MVDGVTVRWQVGQPEEDPGYVVALRRRGATATVASYSGPDITGDPRRMDLPVSTDDLVALIRDPRVALTTTAETVEASSRFEVYDDPATPGRDLPDPDLTEPATSATLALLAQGHTAWDADRAYADPSVPSPGIGVVLDFPTQGGWEATTLRTSLVPVAGQPSTRRLRRTAGCDDSDGCAPFGSVLVAWTLAGRDDPGSITVVGWRAGTLMRASWSGQPVTTDPRDRDGPVLVEEIASLAEDPHLGLLASADLAARAADMPSWWQP